jgi:hypothetical protein
MSSVDAPAESPMFRFEGLPAERINTDAEVVTGLQVKITVGCDVTPCNLAYTHESVIATCRLHLQGKGKGKVRPRTGYEGPQEEQRYRSTLSLTSALDGGGWSTPRPDRFTPGKDPVPTV